MNNFILLINRISSRSQLLGALRKSSGSAGMPREVAIAPAAYLVLEAFYQHLQLVAILNLIHFLWQKFTNIPKMNEEKNQNKKPPRQQTL